MCCQRKVEGRAISFGASLSNAMLERFLIDGQGLAFVRDSLQTLPVGTLKQGFGGVGAAVDMREVERLGLNLQGEQEL